MRDSSLESSVELIDCFYPSNIHVGVWDQMHSYSLIHTWPFLLDWWWKRTLSFQQSFQHQLILLIYKAVGSVNSIFEV